MERLTGGDSVFLYIETPTQPLTSLYVAMLRPGAGPDGTPAWITMADLRARIEQRLDVVPSLRRRLVRVPFGLHHPVWADDPHFDLGRHLEHVVLEGPGEPAKLDREIARQAQLVFDRSRPLWRITLVDGVEDGQQALILAFQHAIFDAVGARTTMERLFDDDLEGMAPFARPCSPERPARSVLLRDALRDQAAQWLAMPALVRETVRNVRALLVRRRHSPVKVPVPVSDTPGCSLPQSFSGVRRFARTTVPLADMRRVKEVSGLTLNDVALAMASTALRSYLLARDDLPDRSLTVNVPVSTERGDAPPRQAGNFLTTLLTTLATDVADPWDRMLAIGEVTAEAKAQLDLLGRQTYTKWGGYLLPMIAEPAWRVWARIREARPRSAFSVQVSNVRGPTVPWSFGTTQVAGGYLMGPAVAGGGPDIVFYSYGEQMAVSIMVNPEEVASPDELAARLGVALRELVEAADARRGAAVEAPPDNEELRRP